MGNKIQKYLSGGVIVLVLLLIAARWFYNYQKNKIQWDENDREKLIKDCIESTSNYAVRFPLYTETYCGCSTDSIMAHFEKSEYLEIESQSFDERSKHLLPVIRECFNTFQEQIYFNTELGDK